MTDYPPPQKAHLLAGNPKRMTFAEAVILERRQRLTRQFLFFVLGVIVGGTIIYFLSGAV